MPKTQKKFILPKLYHQLKQIFLIQLVGCVFWIQPSFAQSNILVPRITIPRFIQLGETVSISAAESLLLPEKTGLPKYTWTIGDKEDVKYGSTFEYLFDRLGTQKIKLRLRQGSETEFTQTEVHVYNRLGVVITDKSDQRPGPKKSYLSLVSAAADYGVLLETIPFHEQGSNVSKESSFQQIMAEKINRIKSAEFIIFDSEDPNAINNFGQWWKKLAPENQFSMAEKQIIQVSDKSLKQFYRLIQPNVDILKIPHILLTRPSVINLVFSGKYEAIPNELDARSIEYYLVDKRNLSPSYFVFTQAINYFIRYGISPNVIYLLLCVPFITFIIAFFRQFIGLQTFGVFSPLMLTLSFMMLGIKFGILAFAVVMAVSYLLRLLFDQFNLLYIPKVALLFSAIALSFFFVLALAIYFETSLNLALAVFPLLVMSTISEKFVSAESQTGVKKAILIAAETVLVSFVGYALLELDTSKNFILARPEIIIVPIGLLVWLGRFTGLRMTEYLKFRALFTEESEE